MLSRAWGMIPGPLSVTVNRTSCGETATSSRTQASARPLTASRAFLSRLISTWRNLPVRFHLRARKSSSHRQYVWHAAMNLKIVNGLPAQGAAQSVNNPIFKARCSAFAKSSTNTAQLPDLYMKSMTSPPSVREICQRALRKLYLTSTRLSLN